MTMPAPATSTATRRILLATDLSEASAGAEDHALQLAHELHADLVAVSVIEARRPEGWRMDQLRARRESAAQALVARGRELGVRMQFLVWEGEAGEAIIEAAHAEDVDMVVVGSHGRGAVGSFFVGSVSAHVVRHAPCPVLVVRGRQD